jgi:hypothetical protein
MCWVTAPTRMRKCKWVQQQQHKTQYVCIYHFGRDLKGSRLFIFFFFFLWRIWNDKWKEGGKEKSKKNILAG